MYLTLKEIKKHLNIDEDFKDDDAYLMSLARVAEQAVERHVDDDLSKIFEEKGELPTPLLQAMKLLVGNFYANRESVVFTSVNELPLAYQYLINLYKKW